MKYTWRVLTAIVLLVTTPRAVYAAGPENAQKTKEVTQAIRQLKRGDFGALLAYKDAAILLPGPYYYQFSNAAEARSVAAAVEKNKERIARKYNNPLLKDEECNTLNYWQRSGRAVVFEIICPKDDIYVAYAICPQQNHAFVSIGTFPNGSNNDSEQLIRITDIDNDGNIELITFHGGDDGRRAAFRIYEWVGEKLLPFVYNGE